MSGTTAPAPICTFSADNAAQQPEKLLHMGRAFGLLSAVRAESNCQIARIVNRLGERHIVLPSDLDLRGFIGQEIVMLRLDDRYPVRRAGECIAPH